MFVTRAWSRLALVAATAFFTTAAWSAEEGLLATKSAELAALSYTPEGLTLGLDGNFYGLTRHSADGSDGTFFRMTPAGAVTTLHEFYPDYPNAYEPVGRLLQAADGNFYGVGSVGGHENGGGLFRLTPAGDYAVVTQFPGGTVPSGGLALAPDGNFYGLSSHGGNSNCGFVYRVTPAGIFTDVADFDCKFRGAHPFGSLVADGYKLYGVTRDAGKRGGGTLFVYSIDSQEFNYPVWFGASGECANPAGGLALAADGWWYGACTHGGAAGYGGIFKFKGLAWQMVMSFANPFSNAAGPHGVGFPSSGLTAGSDGLLYGAAAVNSSSARFSNGAIYSMSLDGQAKTVLIFTGANGSSPKTPPVEGTPGTFFGVTAGVNNAGGVAYRLK